MEEVKLCKHSPAHTHIHNCTQMYTSICRNIHKTSVCTHASHKQTNEYPPTTVHWSAAFFCPECSLGRWGLRLWLWLWLIQLHLLLLSASSSLICEMRVTQFFNGWWTLTCDILYQSKVWTLVFYLQWSMMKLSANYTGNIWWIMFWLDLSQPYLLLSADKNA